MQDIKALNSFKSTFRFVSRNRCVTRRGLRVFYVIALLILSNATADACQLLSPPEQPLTIHAEKSVQAFLNEYWNRSPQNALASETFYRDLKSPSAIVSVAYAVNRIQQNKTNEAKIVAEKITATFPENLDGWMLKSWLNALEDKFDTSLVSIQSLNRQLLANTDLSLESRSSIYSRLGRLIGYLEGPVAHRVNQNLLLTTTQNITRTTPPKNLKDFN